MPPESSARRLVVAVTGTPGTGKSTFAKMLSKAVRGSSVIEINDVARVLGLYTGRTWHGSREVQVRRLAQAVKKRVSMAGGLVLVVGHLAPDLGIKCDIAVVTRLSLRKLESRLKLRHYHAEKMRENLISEALDYCGTAMSRACSELYEIEGAAEARTVAAYITKRAEGVSAAKPKLRAHDKVREIMGMVANGNPYGL